VGVARSWQPVLFPALELQVKSPAPEVFRSSISTKHFDCSTSPWTACLPRSEQLAILI